MMGLSSFRKSLISRSGYFIYKKSALPIGLNVFFDIKRFFPNQEFNTVFDVGANIGLESKRFSVEYPNASIYAFEPVYEAYKILVEALVKYSKISTFCCALGECKEEREMAVFDNINDSVRSSLNIEAITSGNHTERKLITVETVDAFCNYRKIDGIDLMKIDTEGWEIPVLKGADKLLRDQRIKFIFCEVGMTNFDTVHTKLVDLINYLADYNYHLFGLYEISHAGMANRDHYANALFVSHKINPTIIDASKFVDID